MNQNHDFRFLNVGLPDDILRHKQQGNLAQAIRLIDLRLAEKATPPALAACLRAQREMMTRLPKDYPFPREQALERVRREAKGELVTITEAAAITGLPVKRVSYVITGWIGEHKGRVIPATTLARQLVSQERRYSR